MSAVSYSLENVDTMIDLLERKIETNSLTQNMLSALQKHLDAIEAMFHNNQQFDRYYPHMLELQALIYGENNEEEKALQFMKEAVRQAGGVGRLYSKLIRDYIASHSRSSAPVSETAAQPLPNEVDAHEVPLFDDIPQHRSKSRRMKTVFAIVASLLVISGAVFAFVPGASKVPGFFVRYAEISSAKKAYASLTAEYNSCSDTLSKEKGSVDIYDTNAVDTYNSSTKQCQSILDQQNQAATRYNNLIGIQ